MTTFTVKGGSSFQQLSAKSGAQYVADAGGVFTGVTVLDLIDFISVGLSPAPSTQDDSGFLANTNLRFSDFRNADSATVLSTTAAAGKFGLTVTLATSTVLISESALSNTKTDDATYELILPRDYNSGLGFSVTANVKNTGAGTLTTNTLQVKAYLATNAGVLGANLGPAAQNITAAGADIVTAIPANVGFVPGAKIILELEVILTETAGVGTTASINSVRLG
jgi:hypothetical protein